MLSISKHQPQAHHPFLQPLQSRIHELVCAGGLNNIALVPIGLPGSDHLGALLLSRTDSVVPLAHAAHTAAAALLQHLQRAQVAEAARAVATVEAAVAPATAISLMLQVGQSGRTRAVPSTALGLTRAVTDGRPCSRCVACWAYADCLSALPCVRAPNCQCVPVPVPVLVPARRPPLATCGASATWATVRRASRCLSQARTRRLCLSWRRRLRPRAGPERSRPLGYAATPAGLEARRTCGCQRHSSSPSCRCTTRSLPARYALNWACLPGNGSAGGTCGRAVRPA